MLDNERFKTLVPIESLDRASRKQLAKLATTEYKLKGSVIVREGDTDEDFIYIQYGEVELSNSESNGTFINADSRAALYPLSNLKPRQYTVTVTSNSVTIIRVDGRTLERMLAWNQVSDTQPNGMMVQEIDDLDVSGTSGDREWMMSLLQTKAFLRLPPANIERLFRNFEPVKVKAGDVIVRYGEKGDYFYMIEEGQAQVARPVGIKRIPLATLGSCDSFGEDALISDEPRNATVTMLTDGVLMRLSKDSFSTLLKEPLINWIDLDEAGEMVREGAIRVDVRTEREFENNGLKSGLNIPLFMLRLKARKLPGNKKYILYCDTGIRSEAGAFIMASAGHEVYVLKGGLTSAR